MMISSAKILNLVLGGNFGIIDVIARLKRIGLKTAPWGTPQWRGLGSDRTPLTLA